MCLNGTGETVRSRTEGITPQDTAAPPIGGAIRPGGFGRVVDLSHTISPDMPAWDEKPTRQILSGPASEGEFGFYVQRWSLTEHTGTHLDAPGHV
ncbi:cyclase family protein, partial [Nocardiopsis alkaliphila]|uniref:cyclase family protein n=1 Tax=Nocardiopsis alkaliphila TaxID=225762 RepID=UPI0003783681